MDKAVSDLWWKNAVVYCLDVETYVDASGDGVGDFRGLTRRLQYIAGLGVTCIWLMPFYPSPNRDDGYDVSDYYNVDPRYGTLGDFVEFVRTANEQGMRGSSRSVTVQRGRYEHRSTRSNSRVGSGASWIMETTPSGWSLVRGRTQAWHTTFHRCPA